MEMSKEETTNKFPSVCAHISFGKRWKELLERNEMVGGGRRGKRAS